MEDETAIDNLSEQEMETLLRQERAMAQEEMAEAVSAANETEVAPLEELVANKNKIAQQVFKYILAIGEGAVNWLGIGEIPIVGQIIDAGIAATDAGIDMSFTGKTRKYALIVDLIAFIVNLIPILNLIDPHLIGDIVVTVHIVRAGYKAQQRLAQIRNTQNQETDETLEESV